MGTSGSYGGPGSGKPLLPPWASDPIQPLPTPMDQISGDENRPENNQPQDNLGEPVSPQDLTQQQPIRPPYALGRARSAVSQYVNTGGGGGYLSSGIRSHTRSLSGSSGATQSARSGRSATQKLGGYLSNISSRGISEASEELGIPNILGKPINVAISQIVDKLAPDSAILEDAVSRRAICKTLEDIYYKYEVEDQGLEVLNGIDEKAVEETIILSTVNFVFERFLLDLAERIENKDISEGEAIRHEKNMKEYIKTKVNENAYNSGDFKGINWFGKQGETVIRNIYQHVYTILEAM